MRETFTFNVESFQILNVLSIKKLDIFTTDIFFGGWGVGLEFNPQLLSLRLHLNVAFIVIHVFNK